MASPGEEEVMAEMEREIARLEARIAELEAAADTEPPPPSAKHVASWSVGVVEGKLTIKLFEEVNGRTCEVFHHECDQEDKAT
jgi:hypothetical protein